MKERESNIELLRIVAMLMIVWVHSNFLSLGFLGSFDSHTIGGFTRILLEKVCCIGVDIFVMISGWFGIKASLKGFMNIIFQTVFYSALILVLALLCGLNIPFKETVISFYFGSAWWFVPSYLMLYVLSPILNTFVENSTRKGKVQVVGSFFMLLLLTGWLYDSIVIRTGYHVLSFISLYLLMRCVYTETDGGKALRRFPYIYMYICVTLICTITESYIGRVNSFVSRLDGYNSPFIVAAAFCFFMSFTKIRFKCRWINIIAGSSFSVYLVHQHPIIVPYFKQYLHDLFQSYGGELYILIVLIMSTIFFLGCVAVDQLRIYIWKNIEQIIKTFNFNV